VIIVGFVRGTGENLVFVIVAVEVHGKRELPNAVFAGGAFGTFLPTNDRREKQSGEDGDDSNDNEKFDQREGELSATPLVPSIYCCAHNITILRGLAAQSGSFTIK
jgi:hypothetical protein